jgi:predicted RNase H-like HicB family nuclease
MKQPKISYGRETDGRWIAEVKSMSGVMAYGKTKAEARTGVLRLAKEVHAANLADAAAAKVERVVTPLPFYEAPTMVGIVAKAFGIELLSKPRPDGSSVALRLKEQLTALKASEEFLGRYKAAVLAQAHRDIVEAAFRRAT